MPADLSVYDFLGCFFEELVAAGVRDVCISPGSRSTPLAVSAARSPLRVWTHIDERSGGFFALGLAKASRVPVALVCTSGTAAANWLPAVIEAHYARVPLLLLTADRPPELREWGAGQTIDQHGLYGGHVRWFAEAPVPEPVRAGGSEYGRARYARTLAARAVAEAWGSHPGPVHLNWPLREPLEPPRGAGVEPRQELSATAIRCELPRVIPDEATVESIAALVLANEYGVLACGPLDEGPELASALVALARSAGWPVLADPSSQLRWGPHVVGAPIASTLDFVLRDETFARDHAPDVIVRLGGTPVCKSFRLWLEQHEPRHVVLVDPGAGWDEPSHLTSQLLRCDPTALLERVAARVQGELGADRRSVWRSDFERAESLASAALAAGCAREPGLLEPEVVRELASWLPGGTTLYVSNSMPIRDVDAFLPVDCRPLRVLSNRGASGIDGVTSSALGAAAAGDAPVVLLTGDLAFLHDLGGLVAARRYGLRVVIVVLNNDGGGIFSFLPIAAYGEEVSFESIFRTPHHLEFAPAAQLFGLEYTRAESREALRAALDKAAASPASWVVEVPIDRDANVAHYRELVADVSRALRDPERDS